MSTEHAGNSQLVLTEYKQSQPKAKKIFWIFKPREAITGEPFNLCPIFKNKSEQVFPSGRCCLCIDYAHGVRAKP